MSVNRTPRTWVTNEVPTATMLNTEIRDLSLGLQGVWDTYDPTWTATTTNPKIGNGTLAGRYLRVGQTVDVLISLTWGSTTDGGAGNWRFLLPVQPKNVGSRLSVAGHVTAANAVDYFLGVSAPLDTGPGTGNLYIPQVGPTSGADLDPLTPNMGTGASVWRTGDVVTVFGRYEAA